MECRYCQTSNSADDHRCRRCGRRLGNTPVYVGSSAAAPALSYDASEHTEVARTVERETPAARRPITYQPSLFSSREVPRIVPFDTIAPAPAEPLKRRAAAAPARQRPRKVIAGQKSLEFSSPVRGAKNLEGAIYCDVPVAISTHRAMAAAMDGAVIAIALALFGVVFRLAGGEVVLNARTIPLYAAAAAVVVVLYRLVALRVLRFTWNALDQPGFDQL